MSVLRARAFHLIPAFIAVVLVGCRGQDRAKVSLGYHRAQSMEAKVTSRRSPTPQTDVTITDVSGTNFVATARTVRVPHATFDFTITDLNGDSVNDVVLACRDVNKVVVVLSDGPNLRPGVEYTVGVRPVGIAAGDLNGDGKIDLISANAGDDSTGDLSLLPGDGTGAFGMAIPIKAGVLPLDVAIGDFNGDGRDDLVVADGSASRVVIRLGGAGGVLGPEIFIATAQIATSVSVVNFNPDTDSHDDVVTNGTLLLGNGDGTFQPPVNFNPDFQPKFTRIRDLNGDGRPDILQASAFPAFVSVLLGDGRGGLTPPIHYIVASPPDELAFFDRTEDGRNDVLASNYAAEATLLPGRDDGTFDGVVAHPTVGNLAARFGSSGAAVGEFTGDTIPDIAVANDGFLSGAVQNPSLGGSPAVILPGLGGGRFGAPITIAGQPGSDVVAGDFNGDGRDDLAFVGQGLQTPQVFVALGNGNGTFAPFNAIDLPGPRFRGTRNSILAAKVDSGDTVDLVIANYDSGSVSVLLGHGSGGFSVLPPVAIGFEPRDLATGDFNGDGNTDLAVACRGDFPTLNGGLKIALGNGDGTFQAPVALRENVGGEAVVVADFNGDGKHDIAFGAEFSTFNWDVAIHLGKGDGTFDPPLAMGLDEDLINGLVAVDADRDGKIDLGVAAGSSMIGFRGLGNGTFRRFTSNPGASPRMFTADVDKDGWPDLVSPSQNGYTGVLLNTLGTSGLLPPALSIRHLAGKLFELRWPGLFPDYALKSMDSLGAPAVPVTNTVTESDGEIHTTIEAGKLKQFFLIER